MNLGLCHGFHHFRGLVKRRISVDSLCLDALSMQAAEASGQPQALGDVFDSA